MKILLVAFGPWLTRDGLPGEHVVFCLYCHGWASRMRYRNREARGPFQDEERPHGCFTSL